MNTKHTPGPWTHKDSHEETSAIFAGEDRDLIADARTVADARLIAAAPELLAALRDVRQVLDDIGSMTVVTDYLQKTWPGSFARLAAADGAVSAAIAQAEGT